MTSDDGLRELECLAWLAQNRPGAPWGAIDDKPHWFSPGCPCLVETDPYRGFQPEQQPILRAMLRRINL